MIDRTAAKICSMSFGSYDVACLSSTFERVKVIDLVSSLIRLSWNDAICSLLNRMTIFPFLLQ